VKPPVGRAVKLAPIAGRRDEHAVDDGAVDRGVEPQAPRRSAPRAHRRDPPRAQWWARSSARSNSTRGWTRRPARSSAAVITDMTDTLDKHVRDERQTELR